MDQEVSVQVQKNERLARENEILQGAKHNMQMEGERLEGVKRQLRMEKN